jgi:hypothetical protein
MSTRSLPLGAAAAAIVVVIAVMRLASADDGGVTAPSPAKSEPFTVVETPREPDAAIIATIHAAGVSSSCEACHTEDGWLPARFAHERTGYALEGRHERADCVACHTRGFEKTPSTSCASCHQDTHRRELGMMCQGCHTPQSWASRFPTDAHRRTAFPLSGRHAFLPCEECHTDKRDRRYSRSALDCVDCHARDAERTRGQLFDHVRNARTTNCQGCHDPWSYIPARYTEHERCFTLTSGPHRRVTCSECHQPATPVVARGDCRTETVRCASCHEHRCEEMDDEHDDVAGYRCASLACAQCHGGARR